MSNYNQAMAIAEGLEEQELASTRHETESDWLAIARDSFRSSTDYFEASIKHQLEKNMAHFHSRHAPGSKYYTDAYRHRSKLFRPKTRTSVRKHEAAAAAAYFATNDAVHIQAEDDSNDMQRISADINSELINYRLEHSIPWFLTLVGSYQETMNNGVVISYQHWSYKEHKEQVPTGLKTVNEDGTLTDEYQERVIVEEDKPVISLRPIENVRIDPAADWLDPINTSPYLIDMVPMYVVDIKAKMKNIDAKTGEPEWKKLDDGQIMSAMRHEHDSLRQQREGTDRQDPKDSDSNIHDFHIVWVHRNFVRIDGKHVVYYTLGTEFLLSDPKPIQEVYRRNTRPYVMGRSVIEAHRVYSSAPVQLGEQIQVEINETANSRQDNIKLVINKRHYIRRGADIDFTALMRSAPGSGILMDDVSNDIKPEAMTDVTSSSYAEQDRLNADFDDILGGFSQGSVQTNRNMNETVGGMELIAGDANKIEEYQLRVFNETWVEPVLRQILDLEREYETDQNVIAIAGRKSKMARKAGIQQFDWRMLQGPAVLKVNVGFGATNPTKRIEKLALALNASLKFLPHMARDLDGEEVINEIFGAIGSDGARFFKGLKDDAAEDPKIQQLMQQIQELQKIINTKQVEQQGKIEVEKIRLDGKLKIEGIKAQLAYIDKQLQAETNEIARSELLLEQSALQHQQRVTEIQLLQKERDSSRNMIEQKQASLEQTGMDDSKAGVIARNDYGMVPHAKG